MPLPLGLEGSDIHDDAATGVGRLAHTDGQHIAGNPEILDAAREGEGVRRNDADVRLNVDEGLLVKALGVDHRAVHVGENLELIGNPEVIAVAREAIADDAAMVGGADLTIDEGFDHPMLLGHLADPAVGTNGHNGVH